MSLSFTVVTKRSVTTFDWKKCAWKTPAALFYNVLIKKKEDYSPSEKQLCVAAALMHNYFIRIAFSQINLLLSVKTYTLKKMS